MKLAAPGSEFVAGLQNIERAIIDGVRQAGGTISEKAFSWHRGREFNPPPSAIELTITGTARSFSAILSREQVEDSHDALDRQDVRRCVRDAVDALTYKA